MKCQYYIQALSKLYTFNHNASYIYICVYISLFTDLILFSNEIRDKSVHTEETTMQASTVAQVFL